MYDSQPELSKWILEFRGPKQRTICDISCVQYMVMKGGPWCLCVISKKGALIFCICCTKTLFAESKLNLSFFLGICFWMKVHFTL